MERKTLTLFSVESLVYCFSAFGSNSNIHLFGMIPFCFDGVFWSKLEVGEGAQ